MANDSDNAMMVNDSDKDRMANSSLSPGNPLDPDSMPGRAGEANRAIRY
jgi:hypothetical protein